MDNRYSATPQFGRPMIHVLGGIVGDAPVTYDHGRESTTVDAAPAATSISSLGAEVVTTTISVAGAAATDGSAVHSNPVSHLVV